MEIMDWQEVGKEQFRHFVVATYAMSVPGGTLVRVMTFCLDENRTTAMTVTYVPGAFLAFDKLDAACLSDDPTAADKVE